MSSPLDRVAARYQVPPPGMWDTSASHPDPTVRVSGLALDGPTPGIPIELRLEATRRYLGFRGSSAFVTDATESEIPELGADDELLGFYEYGGLGDRLGFVWHPWHLPTGQCADPAARPESGLPIA